MINKRNKIIANSDDQNYPWYHSFAYKLGRSTRKVLDSADKLAASVESSGKKTFMLLQDVQDKKDRDLFKAPVKYNTNKDGFVPEHEEKLSSLLKEINEIAEISGLTAALHEMKENALNHSEDPILNQFISKLEHLEVHEQEILANNFMVQLSNNPYFNEMMSPSNFAPVNLNERDREEMVNTLVLCLSKTFKDMGMYDGDFEYLKELSNEISEPLNKLIQFYLDPQTFFQKVKRIWKLQRIGFKSIKIISKTSSLAEAVK